MGNFWARQLESNTGQGKILAGGHGQVGAEKALIQHQLWPVDAPL